MKTLAAAVLLIAFATAPTLAQDQSNTPASPENSAHGGGTSPDGRGSTGWSGGSRESSKSESSKSETTGSGAGNTDPEAAVNQPFMATGSDLKGPAAQFPANKTPE